MGMIDGGHEEIESIPWSQLGHDPFPGRRRAFYLAAAAVAAIVAAVVVTRAVWGPSETTIEATQVSQGVVSETTVTALYEEADLLAVSPEAGLRAAVARAEWFVTDYFTADLEPNGTADLRAALPAGADVPDMPQDGAVGLSYVEWARAFDVEELGSGRYRVSVVFRLLGAPRDEGFRRLDARAVSVVVAVDSLGGSVVTDLPSPVGIPPGAEADAWPALQSEEPPQQVLNGAITIASRFGADHRLLGASPIESGWRVVVTALDEVGNRWPLSIRVDDHGNRLD